LSLLAPVLAFAAMPPKKRTMRFRQRFASGLVCFGCLVLAAACGDDDEENVTAGSTDPGKGPFGERIPITDTLNLDGLESGVNVVRDQYGWTHIYAKTLNDALRVEGYMMAADRGGQLEIARRLTEGRLAELFAEADPSQIDDDITMRTIGLHRAAKAIYAAMDPESEAKKGLDAFADGVTQWNRAYREGRVAPPQDLLGMPASAYTDWTPEDSLAMARLQTWSLSYDADADISATKTVEAVRAVFNDAATDPAAKLRAGLLVDAYRFDPLDPATPLDDFPNQPLGKDKKPGAGRGASFRHGASPVASVSVPPALLGAADPFVRSVERVRDFLGGDEFFGSNNWAVASSKTGSGNAMVASDPHLGLTSPMVFWPTHLYVGDGQGPGDLEIEGVAFPGIPGVVLGTNRHMAWGATTAGYDVTDVWSDTVSPDGSGVMFEGKVVPFEKATETVKISGQPDYSWDVLIVPHHGPVVPEIDANGKVKPPAPGSKVLSVRWTGHAPTREYEAVFALAKAKNVDEARMALQPFGTGAQNWMFADDSGDIFMFSQGFLPYRDKRAYTWDPTTFSGTLPCFVLDGESGEQEWTGKFLEEQYVPKLKSPDKGWIATANTDQIGSTLDNDPSNEKLPNGDPFYIGCDFAEGLRLGRIQQRLEKGVGSMTPDEMSDIQGDHRSALGARLSKFLVAALEAAEEEKAAAGTHPALAAVVADPRYAAVDVADILDTLSKWKTDSDFEAAAGINLDDESLDVDAKEALASKATVIFNAWLVRAIGRALEDEMNAAKIGSLGTANMVKAFVRMLEQDPSTLATYDSANGQSALWDDMSTAGITETRDDRLVVALLDAVDDLDKIFGKDRNDWRWGALHRIRFDGLNPTWNVSIPAFNVPKFAQGFPRHGDQWNVDASNFGVVRKLSSDLDFHYGSGPVQRFVAELTPSGPKVRNALPGGAVLASDSPFFSNEAELWRRNQTHTVPFEIEDVQAAAVAPGGQNTLFIP
jgi:penicillin amidase